MRKSLYALTFVALTACTLLAQVRPGQFTTLAFTSITTLLNVTKFGAHTMISSGTGGNTLTIRNSAAGAANLAQIFVGNDTDGALGSFSALSSTYTPSGGGQPNSALLAGNGALNIQSGASTAITFYPAGSKRWAYDQNGTLTVGSSGRVTDSQAAPTLSSCTGCGAGNALTANAKDYAFIVNMGTAPSAGPIAVVTFGTTFSSQPVCTWATDATAAMTGTVATTTSQFSLVVSGTPAANAKYFVLCRGF